MDTCLSFQLSLAAASQAWQCLGIQVQRSGRSGPSGVGGGARRGGFGPLPLPAAAACLAPCHSLSPSGTPVTALLSRAGRPAGRAGHDTEPAGYGLRRRPRPPQRPAEARQPVPGITTESKTAPAAAEAEARLALPLAVTLRLSESLSQAGAGQGLSRTQALARGSLAPNTYVIS